MKQLNNTGRFCIEVSTLHDSQGQATAKVTDTQTGKVYACQVTVHRRPDFYEQYVDTSNVEGCTNKGRYTIKRKLRPQYNEHTRKYEIKKSDIAVTEYSDLTGKSKLNAIFEIIE